MLIQPSSLVREVIGAAIEVHRTIGPGLLESAYDRCLAHELHLRGIVVRRQVDVPLLYKGTDVGCGYRADLLIDGQLLVEVKAVESIHAITKAQLISYLRLLNVPQGLIINFNVLRLVDGVRRVFATPLPSREDARPGPTGSSEADLPPGR